MATVTDEDRAIAREIKIGICVCSGRPEYACTAHETIAQALAGSREASATDDEDLAAMMERCEAATEGPWVWSGPTFREREYRTYVHRVPGCGAENIPPEKMYISIQSVGTKERDDADAAFIAHAREDLPRVIKELVATRAENERLRKLDAQSRASGCWCDEYGHPCKACSDKQELSARLAEAEAEIERLKGNV